MEKAEGVSGVDSLTAAHGATDAAAEKPMTSKRARTAKPARQVAISRRTTNAAQLQAGGPQNPGSIQPFSIYAMIINVVDD